MSYRIAGMEVHKKTLAVVVFDVEIESAYQFERRMFGSSPEQLRTPAAWLLAPEAEEVVMESPAPYWKPAWGALERQEEKAVARHPRAARAHSRETVGKSLQKVFESFSAFKVVE